MLSRVTESPPNFLRENFLAKVAARPAPNARLSRIERYLETLVHTFRPETYEEPGEISSFNRMAARDLRKGSDQRVALAQMKRTGA